MPIFEGLVATPITPFDEEENIYEDGIRSVVNYLHSHGIKNLFCIGSWGGFALMSTNERMKVAEIIISECNKNGMKTIINVSSPCTREAIALAIHAQDQGADAVVTLAPYYYTQYGYTEDNIMCYLSEIVEAVDIPVHYYNNPRTTGITLNMDLFRKLLDVGISGMKEGGGSMAAFIEMMDIIKTRGVDFDMIPSSIALFISGLLCGVKATMIGSAMVVPEIAGQAYEAFLNRDIEAAVRIHLKLMKVRQIHGSRGFSPAACYGLLRLRGVDAGRPRSPWLDLTEDDLRAIRLRLEEAGISL